MSLGGSKWRHTQALGIAGYCSVALFLRVGFVWAAVPGAVDSIDPAVLTQRVAGQESSLDRHRVKAEQVALVAERAFANELIIEASHIGKPAWRPMLVYLARLHAQATHPAEFPFEFEWEELGPGYGYGPGFGHWDVVHEILDVLPTAPEHALHQLLNDVRLQDEKGFIPGVIWMRGSPSAKQGKAVWDKGDQGHPPLWVVAADDYLKKFPDKKLLREFFVRALRQIDWFAKNRKAEPGGFFYNDILLHKWESGVDEGIRFDQTQAGPFACIDATCHVYQLMSYAIQWAAQLKEPADQLIEKRLRLQAFIRSKLYSAKTGCFYDAWSVGDEARQTLAFEGLWPLIVGVATEEQASRLMGQYVDNPQVFMTGHPIPSVGASDPKFELRMWRGPAWNSMTYWVARGCVHYGRNDIARRLLERALDDSAFQYDKAHTIWEYFDPNGGDPAQLARKPTTVRNQPWTDYLGHNPLFAMARLYDQVTTTGK